ncbi:MAG: cyclase family protein [Candidatus Xenobia bacterium]
MRRLIGFLLFALLAVPTLAKDRPWIDISVPVSPDHTPVYPGDPGVSFRWAKSLAKGDVVNLTETTMGLHTGTHIDAPLHFLANGRSIDQIPLTQLMGPCRVLECDVPVVDAAELNKHHWKGATRLLFKTRNSLRHLYDDKTFHTDFTAIAPDAAKLMVDAGVVLVGIDYNSIEPFGAKKPLTHLTLLSHNVVIVEGLDLRDVAPGDYNLICLPARFAGREAAPARAIIQSVK